MNHAYWPLYKSWGGSSKKNEVESDSISFMVHGSHAGAEFPGDFDKQARGDPGLDGIILDVSEMR